MLVVRDRIGLATLLLGGLALLGWPSGGASVADAAPRRPAERITGAQDELAKITARLEGLAREISFARPDQGARQRWEAELARLKEALQEAIRDLIGLRFAEIAEVIREAQEVERRFADTAELLRSRGSDPSPVTPPSASVGKAASAGTGSIEGVVTDAATGLPLAGVTVRILEGWGTRATATTNEAGSYVVTGLAPGNFYFAFTENTLGYVDEFFDNKRCRSSCWSEPLGTAIVVHDGAATTGIDFALDKFGAITGTVLEQGTGIPVTNATVYLFYGDFPSASTSVDADGHYHFDRVLGTAFVAAYSPTHVDQVYDGIPCQSTYCWPSTHGTPITVLPGMTATGIDFSLQRSGTISGVITDAIDGAPLRASVSVRKQDGSFPSGGQSGVDGVFSIGDLPPGVYFARASDFFSTYASVVFDGIVCAPDCDLLSGTPITVESGQDTGGINFALPRLGAIEGAVKDASTGFPTQNSWVRAWRSDGTLVGNTYVNDVGEYRFSGLMPGEYFVTVTDPYYIDELYDDIVCQPLCNPTTGTAISLTLNATVSGVDFHLQLGGGIGGRVVAATSGNGISDVWVRAIGPDGEAGSALSSNLGNYVIRDLLPGPYFVVARDGRYEPLFLGQLYDGIPCEPTCDVTSGTPVPVDLGVVHGGIDFALDQLGAISGRVVDAVSNTGLQSAFVTVYRADGQWLRSASTLSDGSFMVTSLPPGTYYAVAWSFGYLRQLFEGMTCDPTCQVTSGTPIAVSLNTITGDINFSMIKKGEIRGTVTDLETGAALSASVFLYDSSGKFVASDWAYDGAFAFVALLPGDYYAIAFTNVEHVSELYSNREYCHSCQVTSGTPISVAISTVTMGIDFILRKPFFADVGLEHWARRWIEATFAEGISRGCGGTPRRFCPTEAMTRWQMSVWLARAVAGGPVPESGVVPGLGPYHCSPGGISVFGDVEPQDVGCRFIHYLAAQGITRGCGGGNFCPTSEVNRWQLAVLVAKSIAGGAVPDSGVVPGLGAYQCTAGGSSVFVDVAPEDVGCKFIHFLAAQGVTKGCGGGSYCPGAVADRAQAAVFTGKAFGFNRYRP